MSKSGYALTLLVVTAISLTSCDSVLDETVVSGITADVHYTTQAGLQSAVNAAYQPLRDFFGDEHGGNLTQYGTDETTNAGHGGYHYLNHYDSGLNADRDPFSNIWSNFYQAINTTNVVVHRAPDISDMTEAEQNEMMGEARFLRALYYFYLTQFWGDVYLTLDETIGVEIEATRNPASEVYQSIIADAQFAVANLPATQGDYGRATKPAAQMLLGQVLLTRAYQSFASASDFSDAAAQFDAVINSGQFSLVSDYGELFNHDNEINSEVIWSVQYDAEQLFNGEGNRSHLYFRPWYENIRPGVERTGDPGYGRPWIRFRVTEWALSNFAEAGLDVDSRYDKIFQTKWYYNQLGADRNRIPDGCAVGDLAIWIPDPRDSQEDIDAMRAANCATNKSDFKIVTWDMHGAFLNMFPSLKKHDDFKRGANTNETRGSRDFMVFRLGDTYLLAAEAYLGAGNPGTAAARINEVRERAAYPGMEAQMQITAGDVDIDFILDERTRELYGEYKRWLDLKRTGKLLERYPLAADSDVPSGNIQPYHLLRPIPTQQIERTANEFTQNPGY